MFPRFGLTNPFQQFVPPIQQQGLGMASVNPWIPFGGINPFIQQPGLGITPFAGFQPTGVGPINPLVSPGAGFGSQQSINPIAALQGVHPSVLLQYLQSSGIGSEVNPLAQVFTNPATASDPLTYALVAQQMNPWAGQQFPIRSLVGGQQISPVQAGVPFGFNPFQGQGTDPYAALIQASLLSQLQSSPYQQTLRGIGGPSAWGQSFPFPQVGTPGFF
jgi:hypothetical protein